MQEGVRNKDDATSVHLCIEELQRSEFNSVLVYKRGDILESFPLEENDFCLIIMSQYEQHMLVKYGNNIIAVDGTYGLNNYDFKLTTLMVVDNFNEGFPGAFMFTNRKDTLIHQIFFEVIESKVGNKISPNTFMSDITGVFYQAWSSVMGVVPFQLYCTWHIDRAWRNNLNKIPNIEKRKEVYKTLKVLHQNVDETSFRKQLDNMINFLFEDADTEKFGSYFKKYYYENCKLWAYCYRKHCSINTNMYLESMHKQIKYFYLHGTTVKRLDKGLHAVLQYSRDKMVEHLIKETKGKSSIHKRNILQRHTTAISSQFSAESIENSEGDNIKKWKLESDNNIYYLEQKSSDICCNNLICDLCAICIHCYTCTCTDYYIKATICKHIHFLAMKNLSKGTQQNLSNDNVQPCTSQSTSEEIRTNMMCLTKQNHNALLNKSNLKEKILEKMSSINTKLQSSDLNFDEMDFGSQILNHLKTVDSLLTMEKSASERCFNSKNDKQKKN
ncbi:hypothetical protein NQ314_008183 [Rhamnusium bicolor]|uniref:MULE transposase domain-containing protein n=1 Tax=Rhamnusium bicolor TaxID=1586634 RepID=A0AAV8YG81_9CUCU|nr:hypothetical protein NQ314_008183 [Rhamnusium bicolor]